MMEIYEKSLAALGELFADAEHLKKHGSCALNNKAFFEAFINRLLKGEENLTALRELFDVLFSTTPEQVQRYHEKAAKRKIIKEKDQKISVLKEKIKNLKEQSAAIQEENMDLHSTLQNIKRSLKRSRINDDTRSPAKRARDLSP